MTRVLPAASEHSEQEWLFTWWSRVNHQVPGVVMYAIPNGGLRSKATAGKLKAEGVHPGMPDIGVAAARDRFHGLYIEMKKTHGSALLPQVWQSAAASIASSALRMGRSPESITGALIHEYGLVRGLKPATLKTYVQLLNQMIVREQLRSELYRVEVCKGWVAAATVVGEYLSIETGILPRVSS